MAIFNMNYILENSSYSNYKFLDKDSKEANKYIKDDKNMTYPGYVGEIIVDKSKDKLIGTILIGDKTSKGFITNLEIDKDYRRQGLGSKLVKDAIKKYGAIDLTVKKSNKPAIALYLSLGFVAVTSDNISPDSKEYYMKLKSKLSKDDKILEIN